MAESHSSTLATSKSYRRQALIWLMMALLLGVVTALVWMFSQTSAIGAQIENAPISTPQVTVEELKQPLSIESLHELDTDVQPIDFEVTVRDLRSYPAEFKDKRYLSANKGKWTVQVMNVAENDVIVSYLEGRDDREKFAYFRYLDEDEQLRYMLTYGIMSSPQEAVGAAKLIDFGLPDNVRVLPEEISRYVNIIDNYERPGPIKDLSSRRARSVNLKRTQQEVPVRQQEQTTSDSTDSNISADAIKERAERSIANNNKALEGSDEAQSIRQSENTSATFSVNEERTFDTDNSNATQPSDNSRRTESETKKPPVVATPKPPTTSSTNNNSKTNSGNKTGNGSNTAAQSSNKSNSKPSNDNSSSANNPKANKDSIKELIEDRSN